MAGTVNALTQAVVWSKTKWQTNHLAVGLCAGSSAIPDNFIFAFL
jgi:hypothetical protein